MSAGAGQPDEQRVTLYRMSDRGDRWMELCREMLDHRHETLVVVPASQLELALSRIGELEDECDELRSALDGRGKR